MAQNRKKTHVTLSEVNIEWFFKTFGKDASISWYLDLVLSKSKEIHESQPINTMDGVVSAIRLANEEIE